MQKLACFNRRISAYFIDFNIVTLVEMLLVGFIPKNFTCLLLIPTVLYFSFTNCSKWQCTLGQRLLGVYVVRLDKKPIDFIFAFDRYISQLLMPIIILMLNSLINTHENFKLELSFIMIIANIAAIAWYCIALSRSDKRTVHDIIFKTIVVEGRL